MFQYRKSCWCIPDTPLNVFNSQSFLLQSWLSLTLCEVSRCESFWFCGKWIEAYSCTSLLSSFIYMILISLLLLFFFRWSLKNSTLPFCRPSFTLLERWTAWNSTLWNLLDICRGWVSKNIFKKIGSTVYLRVLEHALF